MPNLLHAFLHAGNIQARPILGELFDYGTQTGLIGTFTQDEERLAMEFVGYLSEVDTLAIVDLDQFDAGNLPAVKTLLVRNGATLSVRVLKSDESAYVLGLKKVST